MGYYAYETTKVEWRLIDMAVIDLRSQANANARIVEDLGPYTAGAFEVAAAPVEFTTRGVDRSVRMDDTHRVLYRTDTNQVLNVVGSRYKMAQYTDAWKAAERILINSGLDLTGLERRMAESHNGARAYAIFTLPAYTVDTGHGDESQLQITVYTSFDGSWCFRLEGGAVRMLCLNTQVSIDGFSLYKAKHTPSLNIDHAVRKIGTVLDTYNRESERWARWREQEVTDMSAFLTFAKAANCRYVSGGGAAYAISELLEEPEVYRNRALMYLWQQYTTDERKHLGNNQWAVYNTLTHWATHAPAGKKTASANIEAIKVRRSEKVRETAQARLAA
jgi:hypothetical protein